MIEYIIGLIAGTPLVTFAKEKVQAVEEDNKLVSYSVIDGEILNLYNNFKATLSIIPKGEGSLIKWTLQEYQKVQCILKLIELI
ncbi:MLP-like protein 423 [Carex littledalei]|uniref:MLP-like protein 423 n=1 Tax=Carex littledalei TaxID=544730 RepID=A0A833QYV5_9POAL|nr:MLP-like protein 423 [Carex littledalei]